VLATAQCFDSVTNLAILELAVCALGQLTDSLVFVGDCATGRPVTTMRANQIAAATIAEYHGVESMG
jgi:hypothetical protein